MGNVKKKAGTEVAVHDYGDHANSGFEGQTQNDVSIPFISVLQQLSPQVEDMEGAKAGMLFNTVTEEIYDDVLFVPSVTQNLYTEWKPRDEGGGYIGQHLITSEVVRKARDNAREYGKLKTDAGNDLVETFYVYGVLADDKGPIGPAVVAFSSTKIKVYKRFNTRARTFQVDVGGGRRVTPPLFAHLTRLSSSKEENSKGKFHNFRWEPANGDLSESLLATDDPRFLAAIEVKDGIAAGTARAAFESQGGEGDEDIPF